MTIDRPVYSDWEPLIPLAGAAAVTERIELVTAIAIGPYRRTAVFAKQAATLDQLFPCSADPRQVERLAAAAGV